MRGTIHFVPSEDAKWMVNLLAPRIVSRTRASIHRQFDLDDSTLDRGAEIIVKALQGGKQLTRKELYDELEGQNIKTGSSRGLHILFYVAHQGLTCLGPRKGKQPTYVLLDEWATGSREVGAEEGMAIMARRYFGSHGPATMADFVRWTGTTQAEAKHAMEQIRHDFVQENVEGTEYWFSTKMQIPDSDSTFLLPSFDEFLVGYKDRGAAVDRELEKDLIQKNGLFAPVIVVNGKVIGLWKRIIGKDAVSINTEYFSNPTNAQVSSVKEAAEQYGQFLGLPVSV